MQTDLQSAILAALRVRHPQPMTEVEMWDQVGYGRLGLATISMACLELEEMALIERAPNGWKLADTGTPVPESHLGEVGQPEAGAGRKTLPPSEDQASQPTRASGLGAAASASAGSYGEAAPCTETAGADEILSAQDGPSVALQTYIGRNAGRQGGADCQAPFHIQDAPLREVAESSQSGHSFAPSPANSGETGSCGDNLHAFQPHAEHAVILPTPARELPDTPMCTAPAGLDIQIGAEAATDGDQHTCSGSTPSRAATLCAGDVPQSLGEVAAESGAEQGRLPGPLSSSERDEQPVSAPQIQTSEAPFYRPTRFARHKKDQGDDIAQAIERFPFLDEENYGRMNFNRSLLQAAIVGEE